MMRKALIGGGLLAALMSAAPRPGRLGSGLEKVVAALVGSTVALLVLEALLLS